MYKTVPRNTILELTEDEFKSFSDIIYKISGIYLKDSKITILSNRLRPRVKACNFESFRQYLDYIVKGEDKDEIDKMINAVSTNETYFFRSDIHFEALQSEVLPKVLEMHPTPIRIWCAGCSSGEEPYTIAMILDEKGLLDSHKVEIVGSDINYEVLDEAKKGVYDVKRLRSTPQHYVDRYFTKCGDDLYRLNEKIVNFVKFNRLNLNTDQFGTNFDIIFCRNVMIYFDKDMQTKIVDKFYDSLTMGGYLFIGHSESLYFIENRFEYEKIKDCPVYCKK